MSVRFSIVTPTFNSSRFLEETIVSVLDQKGVEVEYIIIDGGSTDKTVEIIEKYRDQLKFWASEPDHGMYDAINKGFSYSTGDVFCWINSDDTLLPNALKTIAEAFSRNTDLQWIHGRTIYTDESGQKLQLAPMYLFQQSDIRSGYHGLCAQFVQQHCCFWRSELWNACGPIPIHLRYAGDYWLWTRFAEESPLISLDFPVATFRRHAGQLHKEGKSYKREVNNCYRGANWIVIVRRLLRQVFRRTDLDARLLNWVRGLSQYEWIDPKDGYSLKKTTRGKLANPE